MRVARGHFGRALFASDVITDERVHRRTSEGRVYLDFLGVLVVPTAGSVKGLKRTVSAALIVHGEGAATEQRIYDQFTRTQSRYPRGDVRARARIVPFYPSTATTRPGTVEIAGHTGRVQTRYGSTGVIVVVIGCTVRGFRRMDYK